MLIDVFPLELAVVDSHSFDLNFEAICYLPIREQKKNSSWETSTVATWLCEFVLTSSASVQENIERKE